MSLDRFITNLTYMFFMIVGAAIAGFGIYEEVLGTYYTSTNTSIENYARGVNLVFNGYVIAAIGVIWLIISVILHLRWQKRTNKY